ncbi:sulfide dehydrogenase (flavoprotein) subunit SudB [Hydrogenispora ethanolica]|uniref:Sulfide dehydrogenase (Flavoprotein) subunit SudB n=1 Tax=Hydrogenispora ethanolica TaxID=1082276 RepID=A0A4R1RIM4_HYDET|nr:sulfide/dihydroorotate dehydrogenase-like FAD/NAD-binding protein [Hydrogenispora ethanolica]TCL65955.1 sulfide dehydrogenase (flavoprotein) subunit SudB [Hydrogenispora ethanolica]
MEIVAKDCLAPRIVRLVVKAPRIAAKAQPGHFVVVRLNDRAERIPLTIADFDRAAGTITLIIQEVGKSTAMINAMEPGQSFADVLGPLGTPYPIEKVGTVVGVAGGLGAAPLYPKVKALYEAGNRVIVILGAQRRELLILMEELRAVSHELIVATDDGSYGEHGLVTVPLRRVLEREKVDEVIAIGPVPMMDACCRITRELNVKTVVSLNAVMVDGTGMCGGCRVTVGGQSKFCCVDGPAFDGLQVDFAELRQRQRYYNAQEREAYQAHQHGMEGCRCRAK